MTWKYVRLFSAATLLCVAQITFAHGQSAEISADSAHGRPVSTQPMPSQAPPDRLSESRPAAPPVRLEAILSKVRSDNPELRAARLAAEELETVRPQVSALPDPSLGITYEPSPMLTAHGAQRSQWSVEQNIPFPGKRALRGEIADLTATEGRHRADVLEAELVLQAKEAYFELYLAQELTAYIDAYREALAGFEEGAIARYEVGRGGQQAVLSVQLEKNRLTREWIEIGTRRRSAAETLARLTNEPRGAGRYHDVEVVPPSLPEITADVLEQVAVANRAELAALDAAAERAEREIKLAKLQFRPDFGVHLTYFDIVPRDDPPTADGRDAIAIGARITIPLQRGRLHAGLRQARLQRQLVAARRDAVQADIQTRLQNLVFALEQQMETLELIDGVLLPQATSAREAALNAYTTGVSDFLSLLEAERARFELRRGRAETVALILETTAALERTLGIDSIVRLPELAAHHASKEDSR